MEALIYSQDWLRKSTKPVSIEEALDEVEKFEKGTLRILFIFNFFHFFISTSSIILSFCFSALQNYLQLALALI